MDSDCSRDSGRDTVVETGRQGHRRMERETKPERQRHKGRDTERQD